MLGKNLEIHNCKNIFFYLYNIHSKCNQVLHGIRFFFMDECKCIRIIFIKKGVAWNRIDVTWFSTLQ